MKLEVDDIQKLDSMQLHGRSDRVTRSVVALPSCPSA